MTKIVSPGGPLAGELHIPGDKSISHRYALLGAMARGRTEIGNFSSSRDCTRTLNCIRQLGSVVEHEHTTVRIESRGWSDFNEPPRELEAGNSGTTLRLMCALLSCRPMDSVIGGDASLNRRPMSRIVVPLRRMGAEIEAREDEYPPLRVRGAALSPLSYRLPVASAQVKSCLLLAGLTATGTTEVIEPVPTRDHTERALPHFGAAFSRQSGRLLVVGPCVLEGCSVRVPGDFSSAIYFILAALLLPGSQITLRQVGLNPTRTGLLNLLRSAGARIEVMNADHENNEPIGDLHVSYSPELLEGFPPVIEGSQIPNLIDEIPMLAVAGTRFKGGLTIRDAAELRSKESDRIQALCENLRRLGIVVAEFEDGLRIAPGQKLQGGSVSTFGDHRIAMSFAIAGLLSEGPVELDDESCAGISFPEFFPSLQELVGST